ncbi:MAG: hypothetical protein DRO88_01035 [Promethearchaeia archaeon]|nr:MAG: hypothetical protein DRO88_01035 [Candidatus Lokiarchaeia archaeon]
MRALLIPTVYGIIAFDNKNSPITYAFDQLSITELANQYKSLFDGILTKELSQFLDELQKLGINEIIIEHPELKTAIDKANSLSTVVVTDDVRFRKIYESLRTVFQEIHLSTTSKKLKERTKILSEFVIRNQISQTATQKDFLVKQAVDTIIELDKSVNFLSTRLREWYGLHFPELTDKLIEDNHKFALFVSKIGNRDSCTSANLEKVLKAPPSYIEEFELKAKRSMGGDLREIDFKPIKQLADHILSLSEYRKEVENYLTSTLDEVAPNLKAVLGAQITGKLIAAAGSLEHLAHMSSSTLQMLGAEKALFKAMRSGGKTPKYGLIFQWNKIRTEKSHLRGKVARMVAGKVSILAKVDYYHGEFIGDSIKAQIDKKIQLLQKQFPRAPKKKKGSLPKKKSSHYKKKYQGQRKRTYSKTHKQKRRRS